MLGKIKLSVFLLLFFLLIVVVILSKNKTGNELIKIPEYSVKILEYSDDVFFTLEKDGSKKLGGDIYFNNTKLGLKKKWDEHDDIRLYNGVFYNYVTNPNLIVYPTMANRAIFACSSKNPYCTSSAFYVSLDGGKNFTPHTYIEANYSYNNSGCFGIIATNKKIYLIKKEDYLSLYKSYYIISEYETDVITQKGIPPFSYSFKVAYNTNKESLSFLKGQALYEGKWKELEPYKNNIFEIDNYCGKNNKFKLFKVDVK